MDMEVVAITKNAPMSPQKVWSVTRELYGMRALQALEMLSFIPRKSARLVAKTLKSALANAENNFDISPERLWIKEATVHRGIILKRWIPKARGMAGPIRKRRCHIRIVLSDEQPQKKIE